MLNSVALRAGRRSVQTLSGNRTQQSHNLSFKQPTTTLEFSAKRQPSVSSSGSNTIASSSVGSNHSSLFERMASCGSGSFEREALMEAIHQPKPIKSGWLDKHTINLFMDKQKVTISRKILKLLRQEEQTVEQDFKKLHQYYDYLPGNQAQDYTAQADDRFHNGFSRTLRGWMLQDLSGSKPKNFTSAVSMKAGLQSYTNNLEAIDSFLSKALESGADYQSGKPYLTDNQRRSMATATENLRKTEHDIHDYRDALKHLVLKPDFNINEWWSTGAEARQAAENYLSRMSR